MLLNPNTPLATLTLETIPMKNLDLNLLTIFAFVIVFVGIQRYFQWKRYQLWHDAARLALEKGQPVPPAEATGGCAGRWSPWSDVRCGLIFLAVGAALYYALPDNAKPYAAIPAFIGVAKLLLGLFSMITSDKASAPRDRQPSDRT
jgi:hypothetical protein